MMWRVTEEGTPPDPGPVMYGRDWATRNLGLFMLAGGTWLAWTSAGIDEHRHPFKATAGLSFGVSLGLMGLGALWGYLYIRRHPGRPLMFWRALQTRYRDRLFRGLAIVGGVATVGCIVAAIVSEPRVAGAFVGPMVWADFLVIANATGGISPI
jgi:hypothetical protein